MANRGQAPPHLHSAYPWFDGWRWNPNDRRVPSPLGGNTSFPAASFAYWSLVMPPMPRPCFLTPSTGTGRKPPTASDANTPHPAASFAYCSTRTEMSINRAPPIHSNHQSIIIQSSINSRADEISWPLIQLRGMMMPMIIIRPQSTCNIYFYQVDGGWTREKSAVEATTFNEVRFPPLLPDMQISRVASRRWRASRHAFTDE